MKSAPVSSLDLATLPEGLRSRGRPLSVHRPWSAVIADAQARFFARVFGNNWRNFGRGYGFQKAALLGFGVFGFLAGLVFVWIFFYHPPKNEDPRFVLVAAGIFFVFSLILLGGAIFLRHPDDEEPAATVPEKLTKSVPDMYLLYSDGLAAVTGGTFEFMAWKDVNEVASVWIKMDRQLVLKKGDDRQMMVWNGFTEMGELRLAIYQQVNNVLLPKALSRIEEGKAVRFGPFTLSRTGLKYKDRKARWSEITSMKIISHGGDQRLTIRTKGRLLAWCWCDTSKISNWNTFYDALCRTAPEELLTTSTKPRW
jgi:hypothetical protein